MSPKTASVLIWVLSIFGLNWLFLLIILFTDLKNDPIVRAHAVNNLVWIVVVMIGNILFVLPGIIMLVIGLIVGISAASKNEKPNILLVSKFCEKQGWC